MEVTDDLLERTGALLKALPLEGRAIAYES
jgi:hypothetical protein